MRYDYLLFDADETLLDFRKSEEVCFESVLRSHNISGDYPSLRKNYKEINDLLWTQEALGLISKDFLKVERFRKFLEIHSFDGDPKKICDDYLQALPQHIFLVSGARELLNELHGKIPMAIITNGIGFVQHQRFQNADLTKYFTKVIVSEECGFSKPDKRIFDHARRELQITSTMKPLMIGDKLETDILGAINSEMDSCWFNHDCIENRTTIKPTHEILKIKDLLKVINYSA